MAGRASPTGTAASGTAGALQVARLPAADGGNAELGILVIPESTVGTPAKHADRSRRKPPVSSWDFWRFRRGASVRVYLYRPAPRSLILGHPRAFSAVCG